MCTPYIVFKNNIYSLYSEGTYIRGDATQCKCLVKNNNK